MIQLLDFILVNYFASFKIIFMKRKFFITIILCLSIIFIFAEKNLSFGADHNLLPEGFVRNYSSIKTIKARIRQRIYLPQGTEEYSGRFTASSSGNFRIDYIEPEPQTVVKNSRGLFWFFKNRNLLFYQEENQKNPLSALDIFSEISSVIKENIAVKYCGIQLYGFLKKAHIYSIEYKDRKNKILIWLDESRQVILKRYVVDNQGVELVKEEFMNYFDYNSIQVPSYIVLFIRTKGGIIKTESEYSDIKLNEMISEDVFDFVIKQNMELRAFNELVK